MPSNERTYNALACTLALATAATYFHARSRHSNAFEVLTLLVKHPLATGDVKQEMQPLLKDQAQQLDLTDRDAIQGQVQTVLEAARQCRRPMFLPSSCVNDLIQRLCDRLRRPGRQRRSQIRLPAQRG
ncbi:MAG: hypothetical protein R3300_08055 [Candidatus Promineifilaceae bacterium]|nr:hypothetical protein [Candidatus Promineifilaceae bacterium]